MTSTAQTQPTTRERSRDEAIAAMKPFAGASGPAVDASTLRNRVVVGYQGWFSAPTDGVERGWRHYELNDRFAPGSTCIDMWPDVSELDADEKYETPFKHADGSPAYVFSSCNRKTVLRHFNWMQQYGIDGAFVQRFVVEVMTGEAMHQNNVVLSHAREGANQSGRTYCVMYDLSGMPRGGQKFLIEDWKLLVDRMGISKDPNDKSYQHHNGKPVVAVWGVGFIDKRRAYTLDDCEEIVDFLKNDPKYGGNTVMLGVPALWRTLGHDSVKEAQLHRIIEKADIVSPWTVGRYDSPESVREFVAEQAKPDMDWCRERKTEYLPVVFPGFSWKNKNPRAKFNAIPRLKGQLLWTQIVEAKRAGASMLYVAMFDEVDESTAIFKVTNDPPVGPSKFVTLEGLPSDHYLKLTGEAGRVMRGERPAQDAMPTFE